MAANVSWISEASFHYLEIGQGQKTEIGNSSCLLGEGQVDPDNEEKCSGELPKRRLALQRRP